MSSRRQNEDSLEDSRPGQSPPGSSRTPSKPRGPEPATPPLVQESLRRPRAPKAPLAPKPRPKQKTAQPIVTSRPHSTDDIKILDAETPVVVEAVASIRRVAIWTFWIALTVSAILLFNLVFDVFKGSQTKLATSPDASKVTYYLTTLSYTLVTSLVVVAVTYLYLTWEDRSSGGLVTAVGFACHFVIPFLVFAIVGRTAATGAVSQSFRIAGFVITVLGGARLAYSGYHWFRTLPDRMAEQASVGIAGYAVEQSHEAAFANVFSPCWKLSYCREVIRRQCPAFKARVKCWKFGKGCFCDSEMFERIIMGENLPMTGYRPEKTDHHGKPPCGECYIYLEHQTHKLRWISPLSIPLAVGLTGVVWPIYSLIWERFGTALHWLWKGIAYQAVVAQGPQPKNAPTPVGQLTPEAVSFLARNMVGVMLGFLLMVAILRIIEMAVDKWKW